MKQIALLIFSVLFLCTTTDAKHIIGGVLTYECLGGGDYAFTMKMYRDCDCVGCAEFDAQAPVSIYRCGVGGTPCNTLTQSSPLFTFYATNPRITKVPAPDYPCLDPPPVCVEEGIYTWKLSDFGISLPNTNESYHIVYQRCCRNETINNLLNPGDQGATFTVEITPQAQRECNNSPVFKTFPPIIICANREINYDHSATDADGDSIVYEFCSPLQGGGNILITPIDPNEPGYNSCLGAQPDPSCPPPYNGVNFALPIYTPTEPMAGNPIVSINSATGLITGVPELQGQFVVGVCATEYRDGIAIGRIIRDFQFNVGDCDPTVVGRMDADEVRNSGNDYYFRLCGDKELEINNTSFQTRFIENLYWEFDLGGAADTTITDWNPFLVFPDTGNYTGNLIINPNTDCGDTANVIIDIFPEGNVDFEFAYDTCVAGPVDFTNLSTIDGTFFTDYLWTFGDGETSTERDPSHNYKIPGNLPITLAVKDNNGCEKSETKPINYFPVPNIIVISPSAERGCQPLEVFFDNLSFPIDDSYDINWDFGDGGISTEISPTYLYEQEGIFTVAVDITSPIGCATDTVFNDLVQVDGSPIAAFEYLPEEVTNFNNIVDFTNLSQFERNVEWSFNETFRTSEENPSFTFRDTGFYNIRLIATHQSGCKDTVEVRLDVEPKVTYFLPNAFTPNNDSNNDTYKGVGFVDGMRAFQMNIWNRWGEMIFETNDPTEGWNGQKNQVGAPVPNGVYIVTVQYTDPRGKIFELQGIATVVR